jgi:hypothetical protein
MTDTPAARLARTLGTAIRSTLSITPGSRVAVSKGSGDDRANFTLVPIWRLVTRLLGLGRNRTSGTHHLRSAGARLISRQCGGPGGIMASVYY